MVDTIHALLVVVLFLCHMIVTWPCPCSPALVGCLWTVTDGDIDRFCDGLIHSLLSSSSPSSSAVQMMSLLPHHVSTARLECKLRWLVGAAPVLYGLPVHPEP